MLDPAAKVVFVLGAGFSRAIDSRMPLTDELGSLCVQLLDEQRRHEAPPCFPAGFFETYLSTLAADQPFLSSPENAENHALFERFSSGIGKILGDVQHEVLSGNPPPWLFGFLSVAHALRAGVITFNYDTLIECLVASRLGPLDDPLGEFDRLEAFFWDELTGGVPAWPPGPARLGSTQRDSLRLLKLHGSLNWYWSPGDSTGATVAKRDLPGSWLDPARYTEADRQRELPGRVPFIVPPTASKSPFYNSPQLREFWQQARDRLSDASHVCLMGYSLPTTDTTTGAMFRTALAGSDSTILIADLDPEPVAERLVGLGVDRTRIKLLPAATRSPIVDLCGLLAGQMSKRTLVELQSTPPDEALAVAWGNSCHAPVEGMTASDVEVRLALGQPLRSFAELNQKAGARVALSSVLHATSPSRRLIATLPDGSHQDLIAHTSVGFSTGRGRWRVLRPSGPSPILE